MTPMLHLTNPKVNHYPNALPEKYRTLEDFNSIYSSPNLNSITMYLIFSFKDQQGIVIVRFKQPMFTQIYLNAHLCVLYYFLHLRPSYDTTFLLPEIL